MVDTIHALATARGRAGVAVIRVSGDAAPDICRELCGVLPPPRNATLVKIRSADRALIDEGLALYFPHKASFSGEAIVELQLHGGPAIIDATLAAIEATGLSRQAEAGEFTRRAFLNGQMDLTQVHGLGDALEAETEQQRVAAMRRLSGETGERFKNWRASLIHIAARLEATIDFSDEDLPDDVVAGLSLRLAEVVSGIQQALAGFDGARALRTGFEVAVLGVPNVGKSSLINRIAERQVAIVSSIAGTTRDIVEARINLDGIPVTFLDTAGLRDSDDEIEQLGVDLAKDRASSADLRIWLTNDGSDEPLVPLHDDDLRVWSKCDLHLSTQGPGLCVSSETGEGIESLLAILRSTLGSRLGSTADISREYERAAFRDALVGLERSMDKLDELPVELVLEDLYQGIRALEVVIGTVDVEALLGEVFSSFCIGK